MKNLLVSFSGGETSAYMAQWLKKNAVKFGYTNIVFVFANVGIENEETLAFTKQCDEYFGLNVKWIEAKIIHESNKGTRYVLTDYFNASRNGEPFEEMIKKYGIPNQSFPHCTRELKQSPIAAFGKEYFNREKYHVAIGIRVDEIDRVNPNYKKMGYIYPLARLDMIPTKKEQVNIYWRDMPFRLNLKGYQGNCTTCWKKSDKKLYQIAKENPLAFDFMDRMECEYPRVGSDFAKYDDAKDRVFFRKNRSAKDILREAKNWNGIVRNDAKRYDYQLDLLGGESCEVWSSCGDE